MRLRLAAAFAIVQDELHSALLLRSIVSDSDFELERDLEHRGDEPGFLEIDKRDLMRYKLLDREVSDRQSLVAEQGLGAEVYSPPGEAVLE